MCERMCLPNNALYKILAYLNFDLTNGYIVRVCVFVRLCVFVRRVCVEYFLPYST